jgi:hypothetical protein
MVYLRFKGDRSENTRKHRLKGLKVIRMILTEGGRRGGFADDAHRSIPEIRRDCVGHVKLFTTEEA